MISNKNLSLLKAYDWPGNIRELENTIERAVLTAKDNQLNIGYFLPVDNAGDQTSSEKMDDVEKGHIVNVLEKTDWKISGTNGAADRLGLNRSTLLSRMKKLNISKP